mmetsp:Transcript_37340/g.69126  ORF Transcript_37340/g.69126 Transcript_37340/m.69126 type:complete len:622 (-) Transcript_37340:22-1887(-)
MPSGASVSSSARHKKMESRLKAAHKNALIKPDGHRSRRPTVTGLSNSQKDMFREAARDLGGSQRNLGRRHSAEAPPMSMRSSFSEVQNSSSKNLTVARAQNSRTEMSEFHRSMPAIQEDRFGVGASIDGSSRSGNKLGDSFATNPELYRYVHHVGGNGGEDNSSDRSVKMFLNQNRSSVRNLAQRAQNEEKENSSKQGRDTTSADKDDLLSHTPQNHPSFKTKDTFNENTATEESIPPPTNKKERPPWFNALNDLRKFTGKIINDHRVQNFVLFLILINAGMMGVATFPPIKNDPDVIAKLELVDKVFLVIFTIESSMQLIYHGYTLFKDGFLVFDVLIVVTSWALEGAQVFRAFRIFRAMRLITRIETLKNLVLALFAVFPKMTAIFMLLLLIYYIFAVMFTQLFKGMYEKELVQQPYFDTVYFSMFTLFQMMTLDEWADILFQIQQSYSWAWAPFALFIVITAFVVVNLIIAVICDALQILGHNEGLEGISAEVVMSQDQLDDDMIHAANNTSPTERRLGELQTQLNDMVLVQDQMRKTIGVLITQLKENASREAKYMSINPSPPQSTLGAWPPPLNSSSMSQPMGLPGEEVSRSRTTEKRTSDGDSSWDNLFESNNTL